MKLWKTLVPLALVLFFCYFWSLSQPISTVRVRSYNQYYELEQFQGTWAELRDWQFDLGGLPGYEPWFQTQSLEEMIPRIEASALEEDPLTIYVYLDQYESMDQARSGFLTWGSSWFSRASLVVIVDTGSEYLSSGNKTIYQLPIPREDISLYEQGEARRKTLIPTGIQPSILWVFLVYFGTVGLIVAVQWASEGMEVVQAKKERIILGPILKGNWDKLKDMSIKLSKFKYTSPPLAEILPDKEFRHELKVTSYIVIELRIQEARTGGLVWARARKVEITLALAVKSGLESFTLQELEVYHKQDTVFGDSTALMERGLKRKRWLVPVGLRRK